MTQVTPPAIEPDMPFLFRALKYEELINVLCREFGYNRKSLIPEEYIEENPKTVTFIRNRLQPQ